MSREICGRDTPVRQNRTFSDIQRKAKSRATDRSVRPTQVEEGLVDAGVFGEFRVESGRHRSSLPDGDRICAFGRQDLDSVADVRDLWGADKDHFQGSSVLFPFEIVKELALADGAVDLASVGVAADADVEGSKAGLRGIFDLFREEDGTGAGAECGFEADELLELLESGFAEKFEEGAGFASGDDQPVDFVELLWLFDEDHRCAELFETAAVGVKIALQGQDSNDHLASRTFPPPGARRNTGCRPVR